MSTISNPALIAPLGADATRVGGAAPAGASTPASAREAGATGPSKGPSFASVLQDASGTQPLRFSRHALERAQRRGIDLGPATMDRLNEGVGRAAGKGSRDSLVLVDGTAFVVSVPNRTVITAVGSEHMREHVFTNVDSAVIA